MKSDKQRAEAHARSATAGGRKTLDSQRIGDHRVFAERARKLRKRIRSTIDSTEIIRADRDRNQIIL